MPAREAVELCLRETIPEVLVGRSFWERAALRVLFWAVRPKLVDEMAKHVEAQRALDRDDITEAGVDQAFRQALGVDIASA